MRDSNLRAANCPSCGAGLSMLGGGRVRAMVCTQCGSALDTHDSFRALDAFVTADRPESPFDIGMTARLMGVDFTLIGTLGMQMQDEDGIWPWVEHQLYSPSHGYAWLSVEPEVGFVLTRRTRHVPVPAWISGDEAKRRLREGVHTTVSLDGIDYRLAGVETAEVTWAGGEFNFIPRRGGKTVAVICTSGDHTLVYAREVAREEREIELSVVLDYAETLEAFGLEAPRRAPPRSPRQKDAAASRLINIATGLCAAALAVGAVMALSAGEPRMVQPGTLRLDALPAGATFDVAEAGALLEVSLTINVDNSWESVEVEILTPDEDTLLEVERGAEYYQGYDPVDRERWTEGNRTTKIRFRAEDPGPHVVQINAREGAVDGQGGRRAHLAEVQVTEGVRPLRPLVFGAVVLVLLRILARELGVAR